MPLLPRLPRLHHHLLHPHPRNPRLHRLNLRLKLNLSHNENIREYKHKNILTTDILRNLNVDQPYMSHVNRFFNKKKIIPPYPLCSQ